MREFCTSGSEGALGEQSSRATRPSGVIGPRSAPRSAYPRERHLPLVEQHRELGRKLRGHYAYSGITGNQPALSRFRYETQRVWRKWLNRRSQRAGMTWERFWRVLARYPLPPPRVVHSVYRLAAKP